MKATPQREEVFRLVYDTVHYPAEGVGSLAFFAVPLGGTATLMSADGPCRLVKTFTQTNVREAYKISTLWGYALRGLSFRVRGDRALEKWERIAPEAALSFAVGSLPKLECLASDIPVDVFERPRSRFPISEVVTRVVDGGHISETTVRSRNIEPDDDIFEIAPAIEVPRGASIGATLDVAGSPSVAAPFDIRLILHGALWRLEI